MDVLTSCVVSYSHNFLSVVQLQAFFGYYCVPGHSQTLGAWRRETQSLGMDDWCVR